MGCGTSSTSENKEKPAKSSKQMDQSQKLADPIHTEAVQKQRQSIIKIIIPPGQGTLRATPDQDDQGAEWSAENQLSSSVEQRGLHRQGTSRGYPGNKNNSFNINEGFDFDPNNPNGNGQNFDGTGLGLQDTTGRNSNRNRHFDGTENGILAGPQSGTPNGTNRKSSTRANLINFTVDGIEDGKNGFGNQFDGGDFQDQGQGSGQGFGQGFGIGLSQSQSQGKGQGGARGSKVFNALEGAEDYQGDFNKIICAEPNDERLVEIFNRTGLSSLKSIPLTPKQEESLRIARIILEKEGFEVKKVISTLTNGFLLSLKTVASNEVNSFLVYFPSWTVKSLKEAETFVNFEVGNLKKFQKDPYIVSYKRHFTISATAKEIPVLFIELEDKIQHSFFVEPTVEEDSCNISEIGESAILFKDSIPLGNFESPIRSERFLQGLVEKTQRSLEREKGHFQGTAFNRTLVMISKQLFDMTQSLHAKGFCFRGISLGSIALDDQGVIKLCDFTTIDWYQKANKSQMELLVNQLNTSLVLQSPQVRWLLETNTTLLSVPYRKTHDFYSIGSIIALLGGVNATDLLKYSNPILNPGFIEGNDKLLLKHLNTALASSMTMNVNENQPPWSIIHLSMQKRIPPVGVKVNESLNQLIRALLEVEEDEREDFTNIAQIFEKMEFNFNLRSLPKYETITEDKQEWLLHSDSYLHGRIKLNRQQVSLTPETSRLFQQSVDLIDDHNMPLKAVNSIQKAIDIDPSNGHFYNVMGVALEKIGAVDQAEQAYILAISKELKDPTAPFHLALLYTKIERDFSMIESFYKEALRRDDKFAPAFFNLGALYCEQLNRPFESREAYTQYEKLAGTNSFFLNNLGVLFKSEAEVAERDPVEIFETALEMNPKDKAAKVNLVLGNISKEYQHLDDEQVKKIEPMLSEAVQEWPQYSLGQYALGMLEIKKPKPDWKKATTYFENVLDLNPTNSKAAYHIGVITFEVKKTNPAAQKYFERALVLDQNNFMAYFSLALTYEQALLKSTDKVDIARFRHQVLSNYRASIQLSPSFAQAIYNLALNIQDISDKEGTSKNKEVSNIIQDLFNQFTELSPDRRAAQEHIKRQMSTKKIGESDRIYVSPSIND